MAIYGTLAEAKAYWTEAGYVVPEATDAQISAALLRGSMVIDRYEPKFSGVRTEGFMQARAWPRTGASTYYGENIPPDVVPAAVDQGSYEAALLELVNPGILSPVVTGSSAVKREKVGQLEVEYSVSSSTSVQDIVALATPVVVTIEGMLWFLFRPCLPGVLVV